MSAELLASYCVIVALSAMIPGPNGLLIATHAISGGRKAAFTTLSGTLCGFYAHGLFSVVGISALVMSSAEVFMVVKALGVAYLFYLGITSIVQALKQPAEPKLSEGVSQEVTVKHKTQSRRRAWSQGFITNVLNPKVSLFYLALFPQFISDAHNVAISTLLLVSIQVVIAGAWFSCVALVAAKAKRVGRPLFVRLVKGAVGSLMLWFGVNLANAQART